MSESDYFKAMEKLEKKRKRIQEEEPDSGNVGRTKRWVRQRFLGAGQFGTVFLASPAKPGSKLPPVMAVKSAMLSESADLVKESRLLKKFKNCPFILDTYGSDVTKDVEGEEWFNVFLEYAQRGTIEDWIQKLKNFGLHELHVRRYTQSLLKGLKYIHGKGFVHCDIKPANVLLVRDGPDDTGFGSYVAKIGDLGLAKRADKYNVMKRSDYINGTELYMSPEVSLHNIQEPPADIWALGCTVLQMLTGMEFWDVNTDLRDDWGVPIEIPIIPERLSNEAKDFLGKCFILDPLERYTAEMLLKHPFMCKSLRIWTVSSRELVTRSRVCQGPAAIPLMGARAVPSASFDLFYLSLGCFKVGVVLSLV
ncbi:putative mitogen-activated protein kinase kinase kinase STE-STE11 family [Rosa chinensis]|uniref:Putative mitogen-activated protein kinase kinase kinase STE-STE11 family n=1 Tax=Rosa chinensis TaxID=74649 RepID=A0A2P6RZL1_ROSCH|nr:putative mitogen-activated protein kinase kinase kinase STE-STE11 family [Rosa chinensis]